MCSNMAEGPTQRPGFNLDCTFRGHLSHVRFVRYNARQGLFVSCDDKSLKSWKLNTDAAAGASSSLGAAPAVTVSQDVQFPNYQATYVTALTISQEPLNLVFVACLDGNLRLYSGDAQLRLRSVMPWSNGCVRDMVFNTARSELITTGSYGVKSWACEMDHEAYRKDKNVDPFAIPRAEDGSIIPWGFGRYQHARERAHFVVPGARAVNIRQQVQLPIDPNMGNADWCEHITLHEPTQTLFAMFKGSVYGYDAATGAARMAFADLHAMPITSIIYAPDTHTLITATLEDGVTVWRIAGGQPHRFRSFGKSITHVVADDPSQPTCLLACSVDGSVALWLMDSQQPMFRMKLPGGLGGPPAFYARTKIVLHMNNEVRLFSVQHIAELWTECNTQPTVLRRLPGSGGLIMAEYSDSSVRLLNANATQADKSVMTIPPQLSSSGLLTAAVSLSRARLYVLMGSGEIHVWQLSRGGPPRWRAALPHLLREQCSAMALLESGNLQEYAAQGAKARKQLSALHLGHGQGSGLLHEHLVLGSSTGDVLVVDVDDGGHITCRFPAFRQQVVQRVEVRLCGPKPLLLAVSKCCLKVWSMDDQPRCLHVLDTSQQIRTLELLGAQVVLGTSSGSVHLIDADSGQAHGGSGSLDHLDAVMGCGASPDARHFVTCGKDGQIKVFTSRKALAVSMYLGSAPAAVCYLNAQGDLLVALQRKLVVVRAGKYEGLAEVELGLPHGSLYSQATRAASPINRFIHPSLCISPHSMFATAAAVPKVPVSGTDGAAGAPEGVLRSANSSTCLSRQLQHAAGVSSAAVGQTSSTTHETGVEECVALLQQAASRPASSQAVNGAGSGEEEQKAPLLMSECKLSSNGSTSAAAQLVGTEHNHEGGEAQLLTKKSSSSRSSGPATAVEGPRNMQQSASATSSRLATQTSNASSSQVGMCDARLARNSSGSSSTIHVKHMYRASSTNSKVAAQHQLLAGDHSSEAADVAADGTAGKTPAVPPLILPPLPRSVTRTHRRSDTINNSRHDISRCSTVSPQADACISADDTLPATAAVLASSLHNAHVPKQQQHRAMARSTTAASHGPRHLTFHLRAEDGSGQDMIVSPGRSPLPSRGFDMPVDACVSAEVSGSDTEGQSSSMSHSGAASHEVVDCSEGEAGSLQVQTEDVSGSSTESTDESCSDSELARRQDAMEAAELRQRQLAYLLQHYKYMNLPFQTLFKVDLSAEEMRMQRRRFGLESLETTPRQLLPALQPQPSHEAIPNAAVAAVNSPQLTQRVSKNSMASGGSFSQGAPGLAHISVVNNSTVTHPLSPTGAISNSATDIWSLPWTATAAIDASNQHLNGAADDVSHAADDLLLAADATGLGSRFQNLLQLLADPLALMDGELPPELEAVLGPAGLSSTKFKRRKAKKKKKKPSTKQPLHNTAGAQSNDKPIVLNSMLDSEPAHKHGTVNKVMMKPAVDRNVPNTSDSKQQEGKPAKKTKRKGRRRGKRKLPALAVLDPAKYLASVARDTYVLLELKAMENHHILTHTASHAAVADAAEHARLRGPRTHKSNMAAGHIQPAASSVRNKTASALSATRDMPSFKSLVQCAGSRWTQASRITHNNREHSSSEQAQPAMLCTGVDGVQHVVASSMAEQQAVGAFALLL